jgi:hypothetical protein
MGKPPSFALPAAVKYLEVFSREEHYIRSLMDAGVSPDMIIFVDCLNGEYDWEKLLKHCSLEVAVTYVNSMPDSEEENTRYIKEYFEM